MNHAQARTRRRSSCSTTSRRFSACCSRTDAFARSRMPSRRGRASAGSRPAAQRARAAGQGRVRARVRSLPRRPGSVDDRSRRRPLPRHLRRSARDRWTPSRPAVRVQGVPASGSRAMRGPTRSRSRTARTVRRTSSDPGRALLTGFVGGAPPPTTGTSSTSPACAGSANGAVLPQQQRGDARRCGRSLHRVLQARAGELAAGRRCRRSRAPTA